MSKVYVYVYCVTHFNLKKIRETKAIQFLVHLIYEEKIKRTPFDSNQKRQGSNGCDSIGNTG